MKNTFIRFGALVLALVMIAATAGCGGNSGGASGGKTPPSKTESVVNDNVNPAEFSGTEITYATWRDPSLYEDGPVVEEFEKKYGITVNIDLINEADYTNTVLGRIASDKAPDVYFSTYTFPYCIDALQPIDAAKLDLSESIWDKSLINISTVNGKTYLVDTVGSIWKIWLYTTKRSSRIMTGQHLKSTMKQASGTMTQ